ncbi:MAG: type II toxin-antitoxin system HicB family antitoxin [Chlamydiia bacterium]|nr:type II toxin-antitoxin system HicB family antitoxin [Chlamydiia bacterium]
MRYHFKIHKENQGFWAECLELSGCVTQADTREELDFNMQEALNLYLEEFEDDRFLAPQPNPLIRVDSHTVEVSVEPSIALAVSIRYQRIKQGLTQREAADQLGMKAIYSYQRLEKRCNPTLEMINKLVHLFPALSVDEVLS